MYKKQILLNLVLLMLLSSALNATYYDWEDINKTMVAFEELFKSNKHSFLYLMSTYNFQRSDKYNTLKKYINNYSINLSEIREECTKNFPIIKGDYKGYTLIIEFHRKYINKSERYWFIDDAYLQKFRSTTKYNFPIKGFSSNAVEYYFRDVIDAIIRQEITHYSGLAKYGKLNPSFFKSNSIISNEKTDLRIYDIVVYSGKEIKDLIFIKLKYIKDSKRNVRGWLLSDFGSMQEIIFSNQSGFAKYAMQKTSWKNYLLHKSFNFDFNKQSQYMYTNIAHINEESNAEDLKKQYINKKITKVQLKKILVRDIDWKTQHFYLHIDLKNFIYQNSNITDIQSYLPYNIVDGKIRFVFKNQQVECSKVSHQHFDIFCDGHLLEIKPNIESEAPFHLTNSARIAIVRNIKNKKNKNINRLIFAVKY